MRRKGNQTQDSGICCTFTPCMVSFSSQKLQRSLPSLMRADMYTFSFICPDQWGNRFSFWPAALVVKVSVHFLVRCYYRVWWWKMLYPCVDFPQVLILEIRRILPSASSKQRTELLKLFITASKGRQQWWIIDCLGREDGAEWISSVEYCPFFFVCFSSFPLFYLLPSIPFPSSSLSYLLPSPPLPQFFHFLFLFPFFPPSFLFLPPFLSYLS